MLIKLHTTYKQIFPKIDKVNPKMIRSNKTRVPHGADIANRIATFMHTLGFLKVVSFSVVILYLATFGGLLGWFIFFNFLKRPFSPVPSKSLSGSQDKVYFMVFLFDSNSIWRYLSLHKFSKYPCTEVLNNLYASTILKQTLSKPVKQLRRHCQLHTMHLPINARLKI